MCVRNMRDTCLLSDAGSLRDLRMPMLAKNISTKKESGSNLQNHTTNKQF